MLRGLGGYMAERATDLYDVRDRAICELRGLPEPGVPAFEGDGHPGWPVTWLPPRPRR